MMRRNSAVQLMRVLTMAVLVASCANATTQTTPPFGFRATPPVVPIPADVRRMAVLYPRGETPERSSAYGRLEGAAFLLKTFRPTLKIIDRFHIPAIVSEQRYSGQRVCLRRECGPHWTDVGSGQRIDLFHR